jgi:hypothetical protein
MMLPERRGPVLKVRELTDPPRWAWTPNWRIDDHFRALSTMAAARLDHRGHRRGQLVHRTNHSAADRRRKVRRHRFRIYSMTADHVGGGDDALRGGRFERPTPLRPTCQLPTPACGGWFQHGTGHRADHRAAADLAPAHPHLGLTYGFQRSHPTDAPVSGRRAALPGSPG